MTEQPMVTGEELAAYREGDDALLIRAATSEVRNYCGWHVAPVITTSIEVDGSGVLLLPTLRLVELVSVENAKDATQVADVATIHASTAGVLTAMPTATYDERWWQSRSLRLRIVFRHGYDSAPDVEAVVMALADRMAENPHGTVREQAGPFSTQYGASSLDAELAGKLAPYRLGALS